MIQSLNFWKLFLKLGFGGWVDEFSDMWMGLEGMGKAERYW